jgi:YD repeat-containing protein
LRTCVRLPHAFPLLFPPLTQHHHPKALPFGLLHWPHPFRSFLVLLLLLFLPHTQARGNLVRAENPDGTTATASYATIAGAEQPLEVRDEPGTPTTFEYLNGNLVWKRDPKGRDRGNRTLVEGGDGQLSYEDTATGARSGAAPFRTCGRLRSYIQFGIIPS